MRRWTIAISSSGRRLDAPRNAAPKADSGSGKSSIRGQSVGPLNYLMRAIRQVTPELVLTWDPTTLFIGDDYINHPDHRAAALASEMPLLWPEVGAPHRVLKVYVFGNDKPNL